MTFDMETEQVPKLIIRMFVVERISGLKATTAKYMKNIIKDWRRRT